jgi:ribonucleoside-diphosphate reductase alpha chain
MTPPATVSDVKSAGLKTGLTIKRHYTTRGVDPFTTVTWVKRKAEIKSSDGKSVFAMDDVEAPEFWSQTAVDIAADKYFRKAGVPQTGSERSVKQMISRVASAIRASGERQGGYFATPEDAQAFEDELKFMLMNQIGSPNSPVWFNAGLAESYGIEGKPSGNFCWDFETNKVVLAQHSYVRPALSACFILTIEDDLMDIARHVEREMRIFRFGGGAGGNFSALRAEGESLSNGGSSSGLMSFLRIYDVSAGSIKSGGTTRRAAKLVCVDVDHPDIEKFIDWKVREEDKALALINAGYPSDFNGEVYQTVSGQNANNSVRVTDEFMTAVENDGKWQTRWRTTGKVASELDAKKVFRKIAEAAWRCADPGLMFDTTINAWNPVINSGKIRGANPCVTGDTLVSTSAGFKRIDSLLHGGFEVVGSDGETHAVNPAFCTGTKPVYRMRTHCGYEVKLTADHLVLTSNRGDVKACELTKDDKIVLGSPTFGADKIDPRLAEFVGLLVGDGCLVHDGRISKVVLTLSYEERDLAAKIHDNVMSFKREYATDGREAREIEIGERESTLCVQTAAKCILNEVTRFAVLDRRSEGKVFTEAAFSLDKKSLAAVLRGLFTADGTVANYGEKTQYVALDSISMPLLQQVQQMLLQFGIKSKIYQNRRGHDFDSVMMPDGRGGTKEYPVQQSHSLRISRSSRFVFAREIGFATAKKAERLSNMNSNVSAYADVMHDTIVEFTPLGVEKVYDLTEPSTRHFVANGLVVHNCNEFHFLDNTACNLSSLNIMKFMHKETLGTNGSRRVKWTFDTAGFAHAARIFTLAKEIIVDYASYPTEMIAKNSHDFRPLGLGYANLGTAIMVQGMPYDSTRARLFAASVNALLCGQAYETSAEIAASKGAFPGFEANRKPMLEVIQKHAVAAQELTFLGSEAGFTEIRNCALNAWNRALHMGVAFGFRNGQVTVTAPTGTIGLLMDCDTTGVEPEFALVKSKKLAGGGYMKMANRSVGLALETLGYDAVQVEAILAHVKETGMIEDAPHLRTEHMAVFDCANKCGMNRTINGASVYVEGNRFITPMGHIFMLEAVQPFVSGSISKTVNMPKETTVEDIEQIYMEAWRRGLKCVALYRDQSKHSQPLSTGNDAKKAKDAKTETKASATVEVILGSQDEGSGPPPAKRFKLPKRRPGGFTQELTVGGQKLYIRTGEYADGSLGEIFVDMHKDGATMRSMTNAFAIAISFALQHGVPLSKLVEAFTFTRFEPSGKVNGHPNVKFATSIIDAVFRVLAVEYCGEEGVEFAQDKSGLEVDRTAEDHVEVDPQAKVTKPMGKESVICSRCGHMAARSGTCFICLTCGTPTGCS